MVFHHEYPVLVWNHGFKVLASDYAIYFIGKLMFFDALTTHYNKVDLIFQQSLRYQYHAENYIESLEQDITTVFGFQTKTKDTINPISPDFKNLWKRLSILKEAEWNLLKLLLKETRSAERDNKFDSKTKNNFQMTF